MSADEKSLRIEGLKNMLDAHPSAKTLFQTDPTAFASQFQFDKTLAASKPMKAAEIAQAQQLSAMFEAVFLVAAADGAVTDPEVAELAELLVELTDGQIADSDLEVMMAQCARSLERDGFAGRVAQVARRLDDPDARRAAFVMAVGVAHIDGQIDSAERLVWDSLAKALDISGVEAKELVDAVEHELGEQATIEA